MASTETDEHRSREALSDENTPLSELLRGIAVFAVGVGVIGIALAALVAWLGR